MSHDTRPSGPEHEAQLAAWEQAVLQEHKYGETRRLYLIRADSVIDPKITLQGTIQASDLGSPIAALPLLTLESLGSLQRELATGSRYLPASMSLEPWTIDTLSRERTDDILSLINQQACGVSQDTRIPDFIKEYFGLKYGRDQGGLDVYWMTGFEIDKKDTRAVKVNIDPTPGIRGVKGHGATTMLSFTEQARRSFPGMRIKPLPVSEWTPQVTTLLTSARANLKS